MNKKYPSITEENSPYNGRHREYDAYIGDAQKERNFWRYATFASLAITVVAIIGAIYLGAQPSVVPHIIEIAAWGEAQYVGPIGQSYQDEIARPQASIHYYIRGFISNIRSISTDPEIIKSNLSKAFKSVTTNAYANLQRDITANRMFTRYKSERVAVSIQTILPVTSTSYQVDWIEKYANLRGEEKGRKYFRGIFTTKFAPPNASQRTHNPLGIFIDNYEIAEIIRDGENQ